MLPLLFFLKDKVFYWTWISKIPLDLLARESLRSSSLHLPSTGTAGGCYSGRLFYICAKNQTQVVMLILSHPNPLHLVNNKKHELCHIVDFLLIVLNVHFLFFLLFFIFDGLEFYSKMLDHCLFLFYVFF